MFLHAFMRDQSRHMCAALVCASFAIGCVASHATEPAQVPTVRQIVVQSEWGGLNPLAPFHTRIVIVRKDGAWQLSGLVSNRRDAHNIHGTVDANAIARLLKALRAPLQGGFLFASLGPHAGEALRKTRENVREMMARGSYSARQKAVLEKALATRTSVEKAISRAPRVTHTDDYPSMSVEAKLSNGMEIKASSGSQHVFMLPWTVRGRGKTWSPAIAQALHAMLRHGATNAERLVFATGDASDLSDMFLSGLDEQLARLNVAETSGTAASELSVRFEVRRPQTLVHMPTETFGKDAPRDLAAWLADKDMPTNLRMKFRVPLTDGKAQHLDAEIERAANLFQRVADSPAMMAVIASHRQALFTINNWYGRSLHDWQTDIDGDEAADFRRYMQAKKGVAVDDATLTKSILVQEDHGRTSRQWVLMPDGTLVLWRALSTDVTQMNKGCPKKDDDSMSSMFRCIGKVVPPGHR